MTLSKSSDLIVAFWLWLALLPVERSIYLYRSIRHEVIAPRPAVSMWLDRGHYAAVALVSLIAVIAIPSPLAVA